MKIGELPAFWSHTRSFLRHYISSLAFRLVGWSVDWFVYTTFFKREGKITVNREHFQSRNDFHALEVENHSFARERRRMFFKFFTMTQKNPHKYNKDCVSNAIKEKRQGTE